MKRVILASNSPRRRDLLKRILPNFSSEDSGFDENSVGKMSPKKLAEHLSLCKAEAVFKRHPEAIVIAADTIVVLGKKILGKPKDSKDAVRMLKSLRGKSNTVITGFTIIDSKKVVTKFVKTKVFMRRFTYKEAKAYVRTGDPMDKAGSYGIQNMGGILIDKIEGDYNNVVGLPLTALLVELRKFGVSVL